MRVLVASDDVGELDARTAADVIGRAFHDHGAQVAVVVLAPDAPRPTTQAELARLLAEGADVVDLTALDVPDFGAALLRTFDDDPAAALDALRRQLAGRTLTVALDGEVLDVPLTGLGGWAVNHSRESGGDIADGLAADTGARGWLQQLGLDDGPGSGAAGGLGAILLACGARYVDRITYAMEATGFEASASQADVVVTGCTDLDFHAKGGVLVERVVQVGEAALRPVIVVARRNFVSSRELRTAGIEAAYALTADIEPEPVTVEGFSELARRVARTWRF
ncbi:MAG: glycerate kinase [Propionibacterium sp.]|nr:glycerate kinase [Propionibacterium sp.]